MIGYFVKAGDTRVGQGFRPYQTAFNKLVKLYIRPKSYGESLVLILIEYHLEGEFLSHTNESYRLKSYRKRERSIAVVVNVGMEFGQMTDLEKKNFIVNTTSDAIRLVQAKMSKVGISDIDFDNLFADLKKCSTEYLSQKPFTDKQ